MIEMKTWYLRIPFPWTRYSLELSLRRSWSEAEARAFAEQMRAPGPELTIAERLASGEPITMATVQPLTDIVLDSEEMSRSQVPKP